MIDYLHDGSFEGFLTCVFLHYYEEPAAGIYAGDVYQRSMLQPWRLVGTDREKAERVYEAISEKISMSALRRCYHLHLSNSSDRYNVAFHYLVMGFRLGAKISSLHGDPVVHEAQRLAKKVSFEAHRLTGLVRFSIIAGDTGQGADEILYAKLEPDHDVLELLGDHFADRFRNAPFLLHDLRRKKALIARGGEWIVMTMKDEEIPAVGTDEKDYRRLWKVYYDSIAIKERTNPSCQKRMMPVRYWKHLTELTELPEEE
jgi:probable DNA metabolism protein